MDMDKRIELVGNMVEKLGQKKESIKKLRVGFCCSPYCCNNSTKYRSPAVVWPHDNLTKCPKCNSSFPLAWKFMTPYSVEALKAKEKMFEERLQLLRSGQIKSK